LRKSLIIILGPTGVGKTNLCLKICEHFKTPVISADSRQIYKEIPIGTAAPTAEEMSRITHYLVGTHELTDYYSAALFEAQVTEILEKLFTQTDTATMCGGSMMYIDAITKGIDDIPTIRPDIRRAIHEQYIKEGLGPILQELASADPTHYNIIDRKNYKRVLHAVEVCRQTGQPYSSFRTNKAKDRPYRIIKVGLIRDREELNDRINKRVEEMLAAGFLEEARRVYPLRNYNSLNTVGYKELFAYFDGQYDYDFAVEKIKRNTRVYARRQMTWFKRDTSITWFHPDDEQAVIRYIEQSLKN
jgi:tRNA dimethylallyltransferase